MKVVDGKVVMSFALYQEMLDENIGICTECGETQHSVEPDAENIECESCGEESVYGLEMLDSAGKIEYEEDD